MDNQELINKYIERIKDAAKKPFPTPNFGDYWKDYAKDMSPEAVIDIAWEQGRRAILLEQQLRRQFENESPERCRERLNILMKQI